METTSMPWLRTPREKAAASPSLERRWSRPSTMLWAPEFLSRRYWPKPRPNCSANCGVSSLATRARMSYSRKTCIGMGIALPSMLRPPPVAGGTPAPPCTEARNLRAGREGDKQGRTGCALKSEPERGAGEQERGAAQRGERGLPPFRLSVGLELLVGGGERAGGMLAIELIGGGLCRSVQQQRRALGYRAGAERNPGGDASGFHAGRRRPHADGGSRRRRLGRGRQHVVVVVRGGRIAGDTRALLLLLVDAAAHLLDHRLGVCAVAGLGIPAQVLAIVEVGLLPLPQLAVRRADVEEDGRLLHQPVRLAELLDRLLELAQRVVGLAPLVVLAGIRGRIRQGGCGQEQQGSQQLQNGHAYPAVLERHGSWHCEGQAAACGPPPAVPEPAESAVTACTTLPLRT